MSQIAKCVPEHWHNVTRASKSSQPIAGSHILFHTSPHNFTDLYILIRRIFILWEDQSTVTDTVANLNLSEEHSYT